MQVEMKDQINAVVGRYQTRRSAIMPALALVQESVDRLHGDVLKEVADVLEVPEIWVYEVATFYGMFNTEQVGKFHLQLCTNVSCMLAQAERLLQHLESQLHISKGGTTPDGLFTLSTVECLGSCDTAPVLMVNQDYHENLNEHRIDELLVQLKRQAAT
ncbi:NADH-quinone oxidoreductase subunit NuoE [Pelagibius sp. Alg239-R121]|uniref:NADH-quinone oxidoreductase subunit NuoE family protein n=1 Tax=Pelagibius sp. Alg239-R121 TaxID=2993448 RepID=UPI0024A792F4|nr:NADH-quinone oxidoreductase subunit NuoE [Pelagibius sp. Alg239-R121]